MEGWKMGGHPGKEDTQSFPPDSWVQTDPGSLMGFHGHLSVALSNLNRTRESGVLVGKQGRKKQPRLPSARLKLQPSRLS